MVLVARAARAFFGRYLYGTSGTYAIVVSVLSALLGGAITWSLIAGVRNPAGSAASVLPQIAVAVLILAVAVTALLYYGARQASMSRRVDAESDRADRQQHLAEDLQQAFLQQQLPSHSNLGFSATYLPASHESNVGGDWYDAFELPDGRIMFSLGDVAGHGVDAAVTMSRARQAIITAALQETDPGAVLTRANVTLMLQDTKFATAICGYIDPRTLRVTYATAGHPPGILVRPGGEAEMLEYDGLPLGVAHDAVYRAMSLAAERDALLVLYTDGLVEYDRDCIAGEQRLREIAASVARRRVDNPAAEIERAVFSECDPLDDVAVMTIAFADGGVDGTDASRSVGFRGVRAPFSMNAAKTSARKEP